MKSFIPQKFKEKYAQILGQDFSEFADYCNKKIPKSIWMNSLMAKPEFIAGELREKGWALKKLFHENAFSLEGIERPGQSAEFEKGLFNLQEKSSMVPALILNPEGKLVLDAAAAPGNKTLQMSCLMQGRGKIVGVEKNVARFRGLRFNRKKFGMNNVVLKRMDLLDAKKRNLFDKVLLDAPCSGEGLIRKYPDVLKEWSQELVERKSGLQKKMIIKAVDLLKEGGELVYSTCTIAPEENEAVIQHALDNRDCKILNAGIKGFKCREGLCEYNGKRFDSGMGKCLRVLPQDNDCGAFFIAKIKKS